MAKKQNRRKRIRRKKTVPRQLSPPNVWKEERIVTQLTSIKPIEGYTPRIEMRFANGLRYTLKESNPYINWRKFWEMWQYAKKGDEITLVTYASTIIAVEYHC